MIDSFHLTLAASGERIKKYPKPFSWNSFNHVSIPVTSLYGKSKHEMCLKTGLNKCSVNKRDSEIRELIGKKHKR